MIKSLKVYFSPSIPLFLWWFGGVITLIWGYLLFLAAYGLTKYGDVPTYADFWTYFGAITFCVGTRSVAKSMQKDPPVIQNRLHGEIWYIMILVLTGVIMIDHFSRLMIIDNVKQIPDALYWTNAGLASLFGVKVFKGWDAVKKLIEIITARLSL